MSKKELKKKADNLVKEMYEEVKNYALSKGGLIDLRKRNKAVVAVYHKEDKERELSEEPLAAIEVRGGDLYVMPLVYQDVNYGYTRLVDEDIEIENCGGDWYPVMGTSVLALPTLYNLLDVLNN